MTSHFFARMSDDTKRYILKSCVPLFLPPTPYAVTLSVSLAVTVYGETGLLTAYNDASLLTAAIENIMRDRTRALERSNRAGERVLLFHEDVVIKEIVKLFS